MLKRRWVIGRNFSAALQAVWRLISQVDGYLVEKADAETGWVFPVPEEARAYGFSQEMRHFVSAFHAGIAPDETFTDGYIVNCVIDACYASMKSGTWENVGHQSTEHGDALF